MTNVQIHQTIDSSDSNGQIDILEFIAALWKNKFVIIACTLVSMVTAIIFAVQAQEWWSANGQIIRPRINDYSELNYQVRKFQPAFETYNLKNGNTNSNIDSELLDLIDEGNLFEQFIFAFNSTSNIKNFLNNNEYFQKFIADRNISEANKEKVISEWYDKISAYPADPKDRNKSIYNLTLQSFSKDSSFNMLNEYIKFVSQKVRSDIISSINQTVNAKKNELENKLFIIQSMAKNALDSEKKRTAIEIDIAKKSGIDKPIANFDNNEIFSISLGHKGLKAKNDALNNLDELSLFAPQLSEINAKLTLIKRNTMQQDIKFNVYRYLEQIEVPQTRDKPKRSLIVLFGTLLGLILGTTFVLIRHAIK